MRITKKIFPAAILLLLALLPACQKTPAQPLPTIRIGHSPHDHHSPLYVAAMNPEYFKKNGGLYLKPVEFRKEYIFQDKDKPLARVLIDSSAGGKEVIRKLSEDHFDLAFGGVPAIINFVDQGSCIKIVAPAMTEGAGLVVGKHIKANNWPEFTEVVGAAKVPLRIGYKMDVSVQELIFESALTASKITYSHDLADRSAQVILVNLYGAKNLIPAMESNLIDGFVANQPLPAMVENLGAGKVIASLSQMPPAGQWVGHPCCAVAMCDKFSARKPELAEKLITLLLRANRFIKENPQIVVPQIAEWLDLPLPVEQKSIPTMHFTYDFDPEWNKGVDFWVESMIKTNKLNGKVKKDYEEGLPKRHLYDLELYTKAREKM